MEKEMKEEELFIPKTKHKGIKIVLAIILIGVLITGGYFLYKEKFNNPNRTVINIIEDTEKDIKNSFNDNKAYKFNGVLKIDANLSSELKPITEIIKNSDLQFILEADIQNKIFNGTINTKYKNEQLMDVKVFADDENQYILLQEIYDKYLKISLDDITKENTTSIPEIDIGEKDIEVIINSMIKALKSALNNQEFKRVSTTIKINNEERSVYNNYVELKDSEIKKLIKDIVNDLSKNTEFTTIFKKLAGSDASITDITKNIDQQTIPGTYRLNFYTNKGLLSQNLVSVRLEATNDNVTTSINCDKINDDEVIFSINTSGGTITSHIKKTNSVFNIDLNVNILGMTVKLDLSSNYEQIKEVSKPDVSNSKKIEDLTIEEQQEIIKKMQENKGVVTLTQDISKLYPAP